MAGLRVVPLTQDQAAAFIAQHHRHHGASRGAKFCIGAMRDDGVLVGVAMAGRPVARSYDTGLTIEITRVCSDGSKNLCSLLYAACWRAAKAMGYQRAITYTLPSESGASLRGAGWRVIAQRRARSWAEESVARIRRDRSDPQQRLLWEVA